MYKSLSEDEKLDYIITKYAKKEHNKKKSKAVYSQEFYKDIIILFFREQQEKTILTKEQQNKQLYEVRKRFFKNFTTTNNKANALSFANYFYNKFSEELKDKRVELGYTRYSQKSVQHVNKLLNR